ncbi:hypothetical protein BU25DRAFT_412047 [Macroventuria anomochaeta]|uniref:Uncharacterized protein n=1 Tax=Macroventuria anomochaeta TaxID=301207 RepID=A0ACB6RYJ5_9PLEO|nr:uncharacterized protein BU25DRAFT_412047 [Macroventuria anomochaeta]KAF2626213.1 hypothetical protein BU25DRAFT_412047 [Macroventuria anomochaeta]
MMSVPTLDFNDSSLYTFKGLGGGSSPLLDRLTVGSASRMEILPMRAIAPNTTYRHAFEDPSLKCSMMNATR